MGLNLDLLLCVFGVGWGFGIGWFGFGVGVGLFGFGFVTLLWGGWFKCVVVCLGVGWA